MHLKRLSKSWRNIFKILFHLAGATILLFAILFLPGRLIKINRIECESQYGTCPDGTQLAISNLQSTSLAEAKKHLQSLLRDDRLVSDYSIQYAFPDRLRVNIILNKARFAVLNKETNTHLLLDRDGQLLGKTNETSLPVVAQNSDTPNLFALGLMEGVSNMYQIKRGEINGSSLVVELPNGKRVIFPLEGDKDLLLGSLRLIYSEVMDKEIDLRFKNPILR